MFWLGDNKYCESVNSYLLIKDLWILITSTNAPPEMVDDRRYPLQQLVSVFFTDSLLRLLQIPFATCHGSNWCFILLKLGSTLINLRICGCLSVDTVSIFIPSLFSDSSNLKAFSWNYWNDLNFVTASNSPILKSLIWKLWNLENV